ncbi:hypothetical protein JTE90_013050, partial [Oedothorax gibbosus]
TFAIVSTQSQYLFNPFGTNNTKKISKTPTCAKDCRQGDRQQLHLRSSHLLQFSKSASGVERRREIFFVESDRCRPQLVGRDELREKCGTTRGGIKSVLNFEQV